MKLPDESCVLKTQEEQPQRARQCRVKGPECVGVRGEAGSVKNTEQN